MRIRYLVTLSMLGLVAGFSAAAASAGVGSAAPAAPQTPPPIVYPTPRYYASTGPLIGEASALATAGGLANGAIARQEVRLMKYGEVSAFLGSTNRYYDPERSMYFVVTSAPWQGRGGPAGTTLCLSYIAVIDAGTGTLLEVGCSEPGVAWPTRLPASFGG